VADAGGAVGTGRLSSSEFLPCPCSHIFTPPTRRLLTSPPDKQLYLPSSIPGDVLHQTLFRKLFTLCEI
jgi:hypothetical protein